MSAPHLMTLTVDLGGAFWAELLPTGARVPIGEDQVLDYVRMGWAVSPRTVAPAAPVLPLRPPPGPIPRASARTNLEGGEESAAGLERTVGRFAPAPVVGSPPPPEAPEPEEEDDKIEPPSWDGAYVKATHLANRGKNGRLRRCRQCTLPFTAISVGQEFCLECRSAVRGA